MTDLELIKAALRLTMAQESVDCPMLPEDLLLAIERLERQRKQLATAASPALPT